MAELQTISAICGVVKTTWHIIEFVQETRNAQRYAKSLWERTENLYRLVENIDAIVRLRQQDQDLDSAEPLKDSIILNVNNAVKACNQSLDELARRSLNLGDRDNLNLPSRAAQSIRFTLSSKSIQRFERAVDTNITTAQVALDLLSSLSSTDLTWRVAKLERSIEKATAYRQQHTPSAYVDVRITNASQHLISNSNNLPGYVENQEEEVRCESELAAFKALDDCIDVTKSVITAHSSTTLSSKQSETGTCEEVPANQDESVEPRPPPSPTVRRVFEEQEIVPRRGSGSGSMDTSPVEQSINPSRNTWNPLVWEKAACLHRADKDYEAGNFSAAEANYAKTISYGERLEQDGIPFTNEVRLRRRLADIYLRDDKFAEAAKTTKPLLNLDDLSLVDQAELYLYLAEISYLSYSKLKSTDRGDAERDLETAWENARYQSFGRFSTLRDKEVIHEDHFGLLKCVDLIISIMEDRGEEIEASGWRTQFKRVQRPIGLITADKEDTESASNTLVENSSEREALALLSTPGRTKLINSIIYHLPDKFQQLLEAGADVNEKDYDGFTPLMRTAGCEHESPCDECLKMMRKLIVHDAKMDEKNSQDTALHRSLRHDNLQAAKMLLDNGAKVDASLPHTPLLLAVKRNKAAFVDLFLDFHANTKVVDDNQWGIIHHAIERNSIDALNVLLRRKRRDGLDLDLEARCEIDLTALMHLAENANRRENVPLAKALLNHGADVNATEMSGYSALYYTIQGAPSPERSSFVQVLLDSGADTDLVRSKAPKRVALYPMLKQRGTDSSRRESAVTIPDRASTCRNIAARASVSSATSSNKPKSKGGKLRGMFRRSSTQFES